MTTSLQFTPFLSEQDLSEETKILISTLPRERGFVTKHIYQYEGFWYAPKHLQGLVTTQRHFQAKHKDIILATNPKCGTTWLKAITFALVNRTTLQGFDHPLLTTNPHSLVPFLEHNLYCETNKLPDLSSLASPRIFGTHIPFGSLPRSITNDDHACKIVYMCRNPKDTFVSLWHFSNKFMPEEEGTYELEDVFDSFCNGTTPFGPFWDHVLGYWKERLENPRKVLFLKYEEIKEEPASQLRRLAEFLECPFFSPEEEGRGMVDYIVKLCSFDHLSNLEVNKTGVSHTLGKTNSIFFRKGEVGDWVNYLTLEMVHKLESTTELKLRGSQFKF